VAAEPDALAAACWPTVAGGAVDVDVDGVVVAVDVERVVDAVDARVRGGAVTVGAVGAEATVAAGLFTLLCSTPPLVKVHVHVAVVITFGG
jgi:hypothetical protein